MPNYDKPPIKDLIATFEKEKTISKLDLGVKFGFTNDALRHWSSGPSPRLIQHGRQYTMGPGLEKLSTIKTPYGEWRPDLQKFQSTTYAPPEIWQADLQQRIISKTRESGLLMKSPLAFQPDGSYKLEFLPARYSNILEGKAEYHHLVFDYLRDIPESKFKISSRVAEGQGRWELAEYYNQLSPVARNFHDNKIPHRDLFHQDMVSTAFEAAKQHSKQLEDQWRVWSMSETHHHSDRPQLPIKLFSNKKEQGASFDPLPQGTHFDAPSKTLFFGSNYFDKSLSKETYTKMVADTLRITGDKVSKVVSVTFRRVLPAVGIGLSIHDVSEAADKYDEGARQATMQFGSFTGAAMGALQGTVLGPLGTVVGGVAGGFLGWEGSDLLYKANKNLWENQEKITDTTAEQDSVRKTKRFDEPMVFPELIQFMGAQYAEKEKSASSIFADIASQFGMPNKDQRTNEKTTSATAEINIDELSPPARKVFEAKSNQELESAFNDLRKVEDGELSDSDQYVLAYLKNHYAYYKNGGFRTRQQEEAGFQFASILDSAGKAGLILGETALKFGNEALGTALTMSGHLLQGISSAMMFMQTAGSIAFCNFVGVLSSVASIISMFAQGDDSMQKIFEAFQEIFHQLTLLRKELHALSQFVMQFRKDLFEFLSVYLGALMSRLFYHEEIMHNGFNKMAYEFFIGRELSEAILAQLDDDVIYRARDFFEGIRKISALSTVEIEDLLTALWLRLDKTSANYKAGVTICQAQQKSGTTAAADDIVSMLEPSAMRGRLAGYLACYYQLHNMTSYLNMTTYPTHVINHLAWSKLIMLWLYARRAPQATSYDKNLDRLMHVKQQGDDYVEFVYAQRKNLKSILIPIFSEIYAISQSIVLALEYSEEAKDFNRQNHEMPEDVKAALHKFPAYPYYNMHPKVSNEFLALAKIGQGKFVVRNANCPYGQHLDHNLYPVIGKSRLKGRRKDILDGKDSSHLHYVNSVLFLNNTNATWRLVLTEFQTTNSNIDRCFVRQSNHKNCDEEGKQLYLQQRRNYTETKINILENKLPIWRETLTRHLLTVKAILTVTGLNKKVVEAFPMLAFPQEITPWINFFRVDTHHTDLYRAWPRPNETIELFANFSIAMHEFENFTLNFTSQYTEKEVFSSSDIHLVLKGLINIAQYQAEVLFTNQSTFVMEEPESMDSPINVEMQNATPIMNHFFYEGNRQEVAASSSAINTIGKMLKTLISQKNDYQEDNKKLTTKVDKLEEIIKQQSNSIRELGEMIFKLVGVVERLEEKATIYVEAIPSYDIHTVLTQWPYKRVRGVGDTRNYTNPENKNHYYEVTKRVADWENISYQGLECSWRDDNASACVGDDIEYVEHRPMYIKPTPPSILSILSHTAKQGALLSAVPESVGDLLFIYHVVSMERAEKIKSTVYLALLVMLNGPFGLFGVIISAGLLRACRYVGFSESNSRYITNVATLLWSTAKNCTSPLGVANTVTYMFASKAALFAEKEVIKVLNKNLSPAR